MTSSPSADETLDTDSGFQTTQGREQTVRSVRSAPVRVRVDPPGVDDDTIVVDPTRRGREGSTPASVPPDDETLAGGRITGTAATAESDATSMPSPRTDPSHAGEQARIATTPDFDALRASYSIRPAEPIASERSAIPVRMAQPPVDGEAMDRSVRGKAQRRVAWVGFWIVGTIIVVASLLTLLIVTLGH